MQISKQEFQFITPGPLQDGPLELVIASTSPGDPSRGRVPAYRFELRVDGSKAGHINLRIGNTHDLIMYFGHIGYAVEPQFRGHHYTERACRLIAPLAKAHGLDLLWIICNPENVASRRTCERLGAVLVDIVPLPVDSDLYRQGDREGCRYRFDLQFL